MKHPAGAGSDRGNRADFDSRVRLEFNGAQISSDGGLLVMRQLDDTLGLSTIASSVLRDNRPGKNKVHPLEGMFLTCPIYLNTHKLDAPWPLVASLGGIAMGEWRLQIRQC